jgi:hypothetical protein
MNANVTHILLNFNSLSPKPSPLSPIPTVISRPQSREALLKKSSQQISRRPRNEEPDPAHPHPSWDNCQFDIHQSTSQVKSQRHGGLDR